MTNKKDKEIELVSKPRENKERVSKDRSKKQIDIKKQPIFNKIIAYMRVSTKDQNLDLQYQDIQDKIKSIQRQYKDKYGNELPCEIHDQKVSGIKERPILN